MALSQTQQIIEHLRTVGTLSQMEATGLYRIQRLASRIDELRKAGWTIHTDMKQDRTGKRYARYTLQSDGIELPARYRAA